MFALLIVLLLAPLASAQSIHDPEIFRLPRSDVQEAEPFPEPGPPVAIHRSGSDWRDRELERQKLQELRFQSQVMQDRFRREALQDANRSAARWGYLNRVLRHHEEPPPEDWALVYPPADDLNAPMADWTVQDVYRGQDRCDAARRGVEDRIRRLGRTGDHNLECWPAAEIVRYRSR